jgi:hypothetical protein
VRAPPARGIRREELRLAKGAKKPPAKSRKPASGTDERERLLARIAGALGIPPGEAELRALRELAERVAPEPPPGSTRIHSPPPPVPDATVAPTGALPERLYLLLDGRGLDGRGLPIEVIDVPTTVGTGRSCTVWVNAPQVETRHLQITRDGGAWVLEDLATEKGTFLRGERVGKRRIAHGDEYRLAGYLRVRTELR